jgi:LAS superfamily LD-carboxypeptidase LdcB
MKKEFINEINHYRNLMGLQPLNETNIGKKNLVTEDSEPMKPLSYYMREAQKLLNMPEEEQDGKFGKDSLQALISASKNISVKPEVVKPSVEDTPVTIPSNPEPKKQEKNTETKNTQTPVSKQSSSEIDKLPKSIQNSITQLKNLYGIVITDEHIKREFEQEGNYREDSGGVNSEANSQINKLVNDAKNKFPKLANTKGIISGYRSYSDQVKNFGNKAQKRGIDNTQRANTVPGFSQHHTGKAFDIFSVETSWWNQNSDVKDWVATNASKYGFDVTYKKQGPLRIAEPWHLYYVG